MVGQLLETVMKPINEVRFEVEEIKGRLRGIMNTIDDFKQGDDFKKRIRDLNSQESIKSTMNRDMQVW